MAPHEGVRRRAKGKQETDDDREAGDEGTVGDLRGRKERVESCQQQEGETERGQDPGRIGPEALDDAQVVEVVVVEGRDAARADRQTLHQQDGDVDPAHQEGMRPDDDHEQHDREEQAALEQREGQRHGADPPIIGSPCGVRGAVGPRRPGRTPSGSSRRAATTSAPLPCRDAHFQRSSRCTWCAAVRRC